MSFLALNMDTSYMIQEKNTLEFEEMTITGEYDEITSQMSNYLQQQNTSGSGSGSSSSNLANDSQYQYLQSQQQYFSSKKNSIESRLKLLNETIEGYKKALDANVKSAGKVFNISG